MEVEEVNSLTALVTALVTDHAELSEEGVHRRAVRERAVGDEEGGGKGSWTG